MLNRLIDIFVKLIGIKLLKVTEGVDIDLKHCPYVKL